MKRRSIGVEIRTLNNLIKRGLKGSKIKSEIEKITPMHALVMGYLYENNNGKDVYQRDLETNFSIRRSTVTGILKLMEKNGLIIREPVSFDARLKKLVLTQKAITIHETVIDEIDRIESRLSKGLTEKELDIFFNVIDKIKKNIE